ncbi:UNVERIFIED_CONTAM: cellulose binding domain-containing protein [Acetivibrio alkalicellulosi]
MQIKNYLKQRKKLLALATVILICLFAVFVTKPWNQKSVDTPTKVNNTMDVTRDRGYYVYQENPDQTPATGRGYYVFDENADNDKVESVSDGETTKVETPTSVPVQSTPNSDLDENTPNAYLPESTPNVELSTPNSVEYTNDNTQFNKDMVSLEYSNGNREAQANGINPKFRLTNNDTRDINLADVKIRYYYINDGDKNQNFWCDWSSAGTSNVTGEFFKLPVVKDGADTYLEIGFTSGTLESNESVEVQVRFSKDDWSNYTQTNHYSFNSSATDYIDWNKVTLYISGELVYGKEP